MKIGYFVRYFPPFLGGVELDCFWYASELAKMGHEVHVFTADRQRGKIIEKKEEIMDGVHIHRRKPLLDYRQRFEFTPSLIREALKHKLDILHLHGFGFISNDITILLTKILQRKTKLVITPHGFGLELNKYPWWQTTLMKLYFGAEKQIINRFYNACVRQNNDQPKWMLERGIKADKIFYIPPCIHANTWKKTNPAPFLKKHNLSEKVIMTYLGRIQKYKGLHQVIQVLPELTKTDKNLVFVMMGPDFDDTARLKTLAKKLGVEKHTIFTGKISEEEKFQALEASEIFILPSEWEAFGMCTVEAMAKRNATISTKTEGGNYLIQDGENGFLFDFGDLTALKTKLTKLLKDKKLRKKMQASNVERAKECSHIKVAKDHEKMYQELLK